MRLLAIGTIVAAAGFGGCAQSPQQIAAASHSKEYFPSSIYGPASRRVIADGEPIPRGGGQYLVGKPYKVAGQTYVPSERKVVQVGNASWYGDAFHGRLTANGEIYDRDGFTAAHPTMPLPSYARVTNLRNNTSMIVRVNDRGPYASNRIMDVSRRVAEALDFKRYGTAKIKVEYVGRAGLDGADDAKLYASLRTDGPARWQGEPTMVAEAQPLARVASLAPYAPPSRTYDFEERRPERFAAVDPMPTSRVPRRERQEMSRPAAVALEHGEEAHAARHPMPSGLRAQPPQPPSRLASLHLPTHARPAMAHEDRTIVQRSAGLHVAPPSRPNDLRKLASLDNQSAARHHPVGLRLARVHDD